MTPAPSARRAARARPQRVAVVREKALQLPVARVAVDVSLPHLDRPFDYLVAEPDSAAAQPGVRVRVRFAGRLVDGFILARAETSEHGGRLSFLDRVVSPEIVLTASVAALCRAVADRYAGTFADVVRLAVPPRHAKTEGEEAAADGAVPAGPVASAGSAELPGRAVPADPTVPPDPPVPADPTVPPDPPVSAEPAGSSASAGPSTTGPKEASGTGVVAGSPAAPPASTTGAAAPRAERPGSPRDDVAGWAAYPAGPSYLAALADGRPARAVWSMLPGEDWCARLAEAALVTVRSGRGALLLVPDARDLARLEAAVAGRLPPDAFVALAADLGPAERYRRFLRVSRGTARVVIGTRSAVFAPVENLGLVVLFDDGDDLYAEPRTPYPHTREVAMLRSVQDAAALLVAGFARTAEGHLLVTSTWAKAIVADRVEVRRRAPRIEGAGDPYAVGADSAAARARITPAAFHALRDTLAGGAPVLVQVPRGGYAPALACDSCRRPARCRRCSGPLAVPKGARTPVCRWCGAAALRWVCPVCAADRLRFAVTGAARTAEEIGRAFPGVRLVTSSGGAVKDDVPGSAAVVVATPGAEPVADGGYGAALLLDGGLLLGRPDLRAAEETLRRWMRAATLVRSAATGGRVIVGADVSLPTVQALLRWDPVGHAAVELAARRELGFPPAVAMASLEGTEEAVGAAISEVTLDGADVLGPVPIWKRPASRASSKPASARASTRASTKAAILDDVAPDEAEPGDTVRALIRVPSSRRRELAAALRVLAAARSARKETDAVRIDVDPAELG